MSVLETSKRASDRKEWKLVTSMKLEATRTTRPRIDKWCFGNFCVFLPASVGLDVEPGLYSFCLLDLVNDSSSLEKL